MQGDVESEISDSDGGSLHAEGGGGGGGEGKRILRREQESGKWMRKGEMWQKMECYYLST